MIHVIGAGAFGTGLAIALAAKTAVHLWVRDADHAEAMIKARENARRLPGVSLPKAISISAGAPVPESAEPVLLAVPMQQLRSYLTEHQQIAQADLIACCKGVELETGLGPTGVIRDVLPDASTAILTGPSFADDIAKGLPTALTLACADHAKATELQTILSTSSLRLYRSTDVTGAELGGALKNIIAIACGAALGAGLGESARAALMTRGFSEMRRYAQERGAEVETLSGLSGLGDLALTCASPQSRNFRYGISLGQGVAFDPNTTVEGAATARAVLQQTATDMPITGAVVALMDGKLQMRDVMDMLLSRPLKEE